MHIERSGPPGRHLPLLLSVALLLSGCGREAAPWRTVHLLDVGFGFETSGDVTVTDRAVRRGDRQYRVAKMAPGSTLAIRGIPWPAEGALEVTTAPGDAEGGGGGDAQPAVLTVERRPAGGAPAALGTIPLDPARGTGFVTTRLAWKGAAPGAADLLFRLEGRGSVRKPGTWLCDGGVLLDPEPLPAVHRKPDAPPNLVILLIDTLRADHVGCYGYARDTTPFIDLLAKEGLRFTRAWAQSSWTKPSTASILTSLPAYDHGAVNRFDVLPDRVWTLAEELKRRGYRTAAFVANGWVGNRHFNFAQGFDHFIKVDGVDPAVKARGDEVCRRGVEWLALRGEAPCFLYLHLIDPHSPYTPPPDLAARFDRGYTGDVKPDPVGEDGFRKRPLDAADLAHLVDLYDGETAAADRAVGAFVQGLEALGLREHTLLVITADHGEEFMDHGGLEHGETLYEEQLEVPLVLSGPGVAPRGGTFDRLVRHMDIAPMALELLGFHPPAAFQGKALLSPGAGALPFAVADLDKAGFRALSARAGRYKLIRTFEPRAGDFLFDLSRDPGERKNLAPARTEVVGKLAALFRDYASPLSRPGLYIVCRAGNGVKRFHVHLGGDRPMDQVLLRLCEGKDGFMPVPEIKGVKAFFQADGPEDVDMIQVVSALSGPHGIVVDADGTPLPPEKVVIGKGGAMKGSWPLVFEDGFEAARIPPRPPLEPEAVVPPGGAGIFLVPGGAPAAIPEADLEDLRALGYFGGG